MKTLWLMRHAKSDWSNPELSDHDRPLKERGIRASHTMAQWWARFADRPQLTLCSTAIRATATWNLVQAAWQASGLRTAAVRFIAALYHAEPTQLYEVLAEVPEEFQQVAIIGHNPGLEDWITQLTNEAVETPTATVLRIQLPALAWRELRDCQQQFSITHIGRPREIGL